MQRPRLGGRRLRVRLLSSVCELVSLYFMASGVAAPNRDGIFPLELGERGTCMKTKAFVKPTRGVSTIVQLPLPQTTIAASTLSSQAVQPHSLHSLNLLPNTPSKKPNNLPRVLPPNQPSQTLLSLIRHGTHIAQVQHNLLQTLRCNTRHTP